MLRGFDSATRMKHETFEIEGAWLAFQSFHITLGVTGYYGAFLCYIIACSISGFLISIHLLFKPNDNYTLIVAFIILLSALITIAFQIIGQISIICRLRPKDNEVLERLYCRYWILRIDYYKTKYQEAFNKWNMDRTIQNQQLRNDACRTLIRFIGIAKSECDSLDVDSIMSATP